MGLKQKFTGDFSQLVREYDKLVKQQIKSQEETRKLKNEIERMGEGSKRAAKGASNAFSSAARSMAKVARVHIDVGKALELVNNEVDRQRRLAKESLSTNERTGIAQAAIADNLPADATPADLKQIDARIQSIRAKAKLASAVPVFESVAKLISATGDLKGSLKMAEAVAPKFRLRPDEMAEFANTAGSVKVATGLTEMQTIGFLETVMSQVRATKVSELKNLTPALAAGALAQEGVSPTKAAKATAAVFAAVSKAADDRTGEKSKTAVIALQSKLEKAFPASGLSVIDQILKIQSQSIEDRKKFVEQGFGTDMKAAIMDLITPMSDTDQSMEAAFKAIQPSAEVAKKKLALYNAGTQQIIRANQSAQLAGNIEGLELQGSIADSAQVSNIVSRTLDKTGRFGSGLEQFAESTALALSGDSPKLAIEFLEKRKKDVLKSDFGRLNQLYNFSLAGMLFSGTSNRTPDQLDESEREKIRVLDAGIEQIRDILERQSSGSGDVAGAIRNGMDASFENQKRNQRTGSAATQALIHDERD